MTSVLLVSNDCNIATILCNQHRKAKKMSGGLAKANMVGFGIH